MSTMLELAQASGGLRNYAPSQEKPSAVPVDARLNNCQGIMNANQNTAISINTKRKKKMLFHVVHMGSSVPWPRSFLISYRPQPSLEP
eukprot:14895655-Ditylum_brightwellii.AAC.1